MIDDVLDNFIHIKLNGSYYSVIFLESLSNKNDRNTALVLSILEQLNRDIVAIQKRQNVLVRDGRDDVIKKLSCLTKENFKAYYQLLHPEGLPEALEHDINQLLDKYKLSNRWEDSLLALVYNNVLFVPDTRVININTTDSFEYMMRLQRTTPYQKENQPPHVLRNLLVDKGVFDESFRVEDIPNKKHAKKPKLVIEINEKMSLGKLIKYLKDNRRVIDLQMDKLTATPESNMDTTKSKAFYWGHKVWTYKHFVDSQAGYGAIEKWLDKQLSDIDVPESRALQIYYKRYINYKDKFLA